jgi:LacI family transcriptional regulator
MSVGFVVRDISNPMMSEIVLGAERALRTGGYSLSITNSEGDSDLDAEYIRYFRQRAADGLLLSLSDEADSSTLEEIGALAVPFVAVDRELPAELGGGAVLSDHAQGIQAAARYLASLGHRRVALITGPSQLRPGRESVRALEDFCESDPEMTCVIERGQFSAEWGEAAAIRVLTSADPATAIITGGYYILLGVLAAIKAFDLRIPADLSIVTFDDLDSFAFFDPPMTALSLAPLEIGRCAAEVLLAQLAGRTPPPRLISPVFRPRRSCGPAPG